MVVFEGEGKGYTHYADLCPTDYPELNFEDGKAFGQLTAVWMLQKGFLEIFNQWCNLAKEGRVTEWQGVQGWVTVLDAHGDIVDGVWCYQDCLEDRSKAMVPVQKWVDSQDGKTIVLLILCCNPRNQGKIYSERSLVIHGRNSLTSGGFFSRRARLTMYVPGFGYTDAKNEQQIKKVLSLMQFGKPRPFPRK